MKTINLKQLRGTLMSGLMLAGAYIITNVLGADAAHAQQVSNLQGVIHNAQTNIQGAANLVYMAAYTGGITALMMGAFKLKAHAENPGQTPMAHGLGRIGVGAALVALPSVATTVSNTLGQNTTQGLTGGSIQGIAPQN